MEFELAFSHGRRSAPAAGKEDWRSMAAGDRARRTGTRWPRRAQQAGTRRPATTSASKSLVACDALASRSLEVVSLAFFLPCLVGEAGEELGGDVLAEELGRVPLSCSVFDARKKNGNDGSVMMTTGWKAVKELKLKMRDICVFSFRDESGTRFQDDKARFRLVILPRATEKALLDVTRTSMYY